MSSLLKNTLLLAFLLHTTLLFSEDNSVTASEDQIIESLSSKLSDRETTHKGEAFLDFDSIAKEVLEGRVIEPPPEKGTESEFNDERIRENAIAFSEEYSLILFNASSKNQKRSQLIKQFRDILIVNKNAFDDSVFDYSKTLGHHFNDKELPKTDKLFSKIDEEARTALYIAKHIFRRRHPQRKTGYAYPSSHSARAFLYETLLSKALPKYHKELYQQAESKAWHRVILGRHYPSDTCAGQDYGEYLAEEFLKNPRFEERWNEVCEEIHQHFGKKG